ncbi:hypothetical protein NM688_g6742 [Phlebia brevispora]|uniref:Uncharacterized protein n=1 Tax=Phlebia brevispora TaxID=194682 RepID=A0ACC1SCV9_9APHY|nr:hypothetical protein NM688_g6742 [Phlebia brevispora]
MTSNQNSTNSLFQAFVPLTHVPLNRGGNTQPQAAAALNTMLRDDDHVIPVRGFIEGVSAIETQKQARKLLERGFTRVPPTFDMPWSQQTMLFRTSFENAINVTQFAGEESEFYGSHLSGSLTPAFKFDKPCTINYRIQWPGYTPREYPIEIQPETTVYQLAKELCRTVLLYFEERVKLPNVHASATYQLAIGNDRPTWQDSVILIEHIWLDSLVFVPVGRYYVSRFYLHR